jgi:hypothetical protein
LADRRSRTSMAKAVGRRHEITAEEG